MHRAAGTTRTIVLVAAAAAGLILGCRQADGPGEPADGHLKWHDDGSAVTGWPVTTLVRGRVVVRDRTFCGEPGYGKFIERQPVSQPAPAAG